MRRAFIPAVIILILCLTLTACSREDKSTIPDVEETPPTLHDYIINGNFSGDFEKSQQNGEEWAKMWLTYTYPDDGITNIQSRYKSAASYSQLSDNFELYPIICSLEFTSPKPIAGAVKREGTQYALNVLVVTVKEDSKMTLSGYLGPTEFDEYNAMPKVYQVVSEDPRFSEQLKPYPEFILPKEITAIDMRQISIDGDTYLENMLSDGIVASVIRGEDNLTLDVSLYDLIQNKSLGKQHLGQYYTFNSDVEDGKLVIIAQLNATSTPEAITIDNAGNITREPYSESKAFVRFSPDGQKYAYSNKGSLYLADRQGEEPPQLLMQGNTSGNEEWNYYYPFCWASNTLFVYGIGGYEWSNGCGVYDLATGKNTLFKQAGPNASPSEFRNGLLFTVTGDMGAVYDPYVIDVTNPEFLSRKIFTDQEFLKTIGRAVYTVSPSGSKIAVLMEDSPEGSGKYILYLCSVTDGSVIKKYQFQTVFNSAQYMDFATDDLLAVFSQRHALSAKYMYLVRLD